MRYTNLLKDNPLNNVATKMDMGMRGQTSQGMIVQNYCQAITSQAFVRFDIESLNKIETKINTGLEKAKAHANYYVGTLQPEIITNITHIDNYFNLYNAVPVLIPTGASNDQWINMLNELKRQADLYSKLSKATADKIGIFYIQLGEDATEFKSNVTTLNSIVGGNNGVLADLEKQIADMDGKIAGAIGGIVASSFAVIGGIFVIAVGAIAGFVTAGTSSVVVLAGAVLLAGGIAGAVGFGIMLANLLEAKAKTLQTQERLKAEVAAIAGISGNYTDLTTQVSAAQKAANDMKNAWEFLSSDLGTLSYDLGQGILSGEELRKLWLTAANSAVGTVKNDINIIKGQMTGLLTSNAPDDKTLQDFIKQQEASKNAVFFPDVYSRFRFN